MKCIIGNIRNYNFLLIIISLMCLFNGNIIHAKASLEEHVLDLAAEIGPVMTTYKVGLKYLTGNGINKNTKKAFNLIIPQQLAVRCPLWYKGGHATSQENRT